MALPHQFKVRPFTESMWLEGGAYKFGTRRRFKIHRYDGVGANYVTEGGNFETEAEAQAGR